HEAHCEDTDIAGGHICLLDWPIANVHNSLQLYLVGELLPILSPSLTFVPHCVIGMLWSINGWSWSDAIPNLPTRGSALAAGIYFTLPDVVEAKEYLKQRGVDVGMD
ncbi:hypothetical protein C3L33_04351, partial [Rhododendron williamsianum]